MNSVKEEWLRRCGTLTHEQALRVERRIDDIVDCMNSSHAYKQEILHMLYGVFLLELHGMENATIRERRLPPRVEEIFGQFLRLVALHFVEHHDIGFYAEKLNISTVYLSRVVRQVANRTVIDYINQMLLMEATFLLSTTTFSISQIAERLHFADTASFSKFFSREEGVSPRRYRES